MNYSRILFISVILSVVGVAGAFQQLVIRPVHAQMQRLSPGLHAQVTTTPVPGILLQWNPSVTPGVTNPTYNVWRGTTTGGPYGPNPVNPAPISAVAFADTTGVAGTTYFYVVRAINSKGQASGNSNEVSAVFPAPVEPVPNPPSGLTAVASQAVVAP